MYKLEIANLLKLNGKDNNMLVLLLESVSFTEYDEYDSASRVQSKLADIIENANEYDIDYIEPHGFVTDDEIEAVMNAYKEKLSNEINNNVYGKMFIVDLLGKNPVIQEIIDYKKMLERVEMFTHEYSDGFDEGYGLGYSEGMDGANEPDEDLIYNHLWTDGLQFGSIQNSGLLKGVDFGYPDGYEQH